MTYTKPDYFSPCVCIIQSFCMGSKQLLSFFFIFRPYNAAPIIHFVMSFFFSLSESPNIVSDYQTRVSKINIHPSLSHAPYRPRSQVSSEATIFIFYFLILTHLDQILKIRRHLVTDGVSMHLSSWRKSHGVVSREFCPFFHFSTRLMKK